MSSEKGIIEEHFYKIENYRKQQCKKFKTEEMLGEIKFKNLETISVKQFNQKIEKIFDKIIVKFTRLKETFSKEEDNDLHLRFCLKSAHLTNPISIEYVNSKQLTSKLLLDRITAIQNLNKNFNLSTGDIRLSILKTRMPPWGGVSTNKKIIKNVSVNKKEET
ncbi:hypothetical protein CHUAL_010744 [Chamberlinius hualienensis]